MLEALNQNDYHYICDVDFTGEDLFIKTLRSVLEGGKAPSTIDLAIVNHMKKYINRRLNDAVRRSPEFHDVIVPAYIKICPNKRLSDMFPDFCSHFQYAHLPHVIQDAPPDSPLFTPLPAKFPPPVNSTAKIIPKRTVTIKNPGYKIHWNWRGYRYHHISTGLYAKQGQLVRMTVPKHLTGKFSIQIGSGDHLYGRNLEKILNGEKVIRPALIDQRYDKNIIKEKTRICTPYGGLIYIDIYIDNKYGDFELEFENVLDSPRFIYGQSDNKSWQESMEDSEAPMVELELPGIIIFTMAKLSIEKVKPNMEKVAEQWKEIMDTFNDLLGFGFPFPQRYKSDVEISVGSEHAGYPMMCSGIDGCSYVWDLTDKTGKGINSGKAWGVFHEIGHMLHERRWTPTALREVTNNIMAEYVNEKLFNSKPAASSTAMTAKFRRGGKKFENLGRWEFVNIFMIVVDECGWETYEKFFRYYNEKMPHYLSSTVSPATDEIRFSTIAKVLSLSCNKNLVPYFRWWNWPVLDDTVEETQSLPVWENVEQMLDLSVAKCDEGKRCFSDPKIKH